MLVDQQHAINGEPVAATRQGRGDRGINLHSRMPRCAFAAQVVRGPEINVKRHNINRCPVMLALPAVTVEKAINDPLGRAKRPVFGDDGGDSRSSAGFGSAFRARSPQRDRGEQVTTGQRKSMTRRLAAAPVTILPMINKYSSFLQRTGV